MAPWGVSALLLLLLASSAAAQPAPPLPTININTAAAEALVNNTALSARAPRARVPA